MTGATKSGWRGHACAWKCSHHLHCWGKFLIQAPGIVSSKEHGRHIPRTCRTACEIFACERSTSRNIDRRSALACEEVAKHARHALVTVQSDVQGAIDEDET